MVLDDGCKLADQPLIVFRASGVWLIGLAIPLPVGPLHNVSQPIRVSQNKRRANLRDGFLPVERHTRKRRLYA